MIILLWTLQGLLALHTVMGALWKLGNTAEQAVPSLSAIPHGVWLAMSGFEIICAACLLLPAIVKPLRIALPLAAIGIALEMLAISALHIASGDPSFGPVIYWLVVAGLSGFIAYARLRLKPLPR